MSRVPCHTVGMNMKKLMGIGSNANLINLNFGPRLIAMFGTARLVRQPDGRHELLGGTAADCTAAREWCSLFAPEVVFSTPRPSRHLALCHPRINF
jgi:hypothetical protein